jgi:hypothetical protein
MRGLDLREGGFRAGGGVRDGRRARVEIARLEAWERLLWGPTVNLWTDGRDGARRLLKRFWVLKNGVGFVKRADILFPAST